MTAHNTTVFLLSISLNQRFSNQIALHLNGTFLDVILAVCIVHTNYHLKTSLLNMGNGIFNMTLAKPNKIVITVEKENERDWIV